MKLKAIVGKKNKVADRAGRKRKNYLNKSSTSCSVVIKSDPDENVAPEALLESPVSCVQLCFTCMYKCSKSVNVCFCLTRKPRKDSMLG